MGFPKRVFITGCFLRPGSNTVSSNASSQATVPIRYLIRPDGYVALAAPANDAEAELDPENETVG
jgi:hypothetical protein